MSLICAIAEIDYLVIPTCEEMMTAPQTVSSVANSFAVSSSLLAAITSIALAIIFTSRGGRFQLGSMQLQVFPRQKKPIPTEPEVNADTAELAPAERQYRLAKAYHEQSLAQSRLTMWFSLVFAAFGFIVIVSGVFSGQQWIGKSLQLASGTVVDAVAALFFVQSNKARQLMSDFFDKLRTDRKLDESLKLIESIKNLKLQGRIQAAVAVRFASVEIGDETLLSLLDDPTEMRNTAVSLNASGSSVYVSSDGTRVGGNASVIVTPAAQNELR